MIGPLAAVLIVVEIVVYVVVAHATSWWFVVLLTLATSLAGSAVLSRTAGRAVREARAARAGHGVRSAGLADTAMTFAGGVLLLVPGFVTDAAGALLLLAPTRRLLRRVVGPRLVARFLRSRVAHRRPAGRPGSWPGVDHEVIEGEIIDEPVDSRTPRRPG